MASNKSLPARHITIMIIALLCFFNFLIVEGGVDSNILSPSHIFSHIKRTKNKIHLHHMLSPLLSSRRNHECSIIENEAIFFGGRYNNKVERLNLTSGKRTESEPFEALNINHVSYVVADHTAHPEIWIPCGFSGDAVNNETSVDYVIILAKDPITGNYIPRRGPKHTTSTGACSAALLKLDGPTKPGAICKFSGSQGMHDIFLFFFFVQV